MKERVWLAIVCVMLFGLMAFQWGRLYERQDPHCSLLIARHFSPSVLP